MPQFLAAVVAEIGWSLVGSASTFAAGSFLVFNAGAIAGGVLLVGGLAATNSMRKKAKRKAADAYNSAQVDRLVNVNTSIAPRELVLGRVRKGGHVFFRGSVGTYKEKYVMLIALAAHEIDGIEQIYFNNEPVTLDVDGYVQSEPYLLSRVDSGYVDGGTAPPEAIPGTIVTSTTEEGTFTSYQYSVSTPKARVRWYLGTDSQAAAPDVMADFPTLWTANHRARGVAYLHCEFWYDETAFPSGLPTVTALMRGAKIYDPRSATTAFTENPALMQRHVLLHPQFGKRASLSAAEDARITAAANACDTSYNYGDGAVAMYRAGLVVPFGAAPRDVLDDLAQAMGGSWAYAAGDFYTKAGVYTAPVMSLGVQDLVRYIESSGGGREEVPMVVATHRSRNEKINVITPRIYDAAQDYKQAALAPLKVSSYISRDGAELAQEVDMQAVGYAKQAHHIAGIMLRDARDPLTFTATFKLKTWPLELFDAISLTLPVYGWTAKTFEIRSRVYMPGQGVQLTLKETAAAITQPDASFPAQGFAANTSRPRPWDIAPPSITAIASGDAELVLLSDGTVAPRVLVSWSAILDLSISQSGQVEIEWQEAGKPSRQTVRVSGALTQALLDGVPDGRSILIRARTRNAVAVSDWSVQQEHFVVGKTAPPPAFDVFTVLAQPDGTRQYNFGYTSTAQPLDWLGAQIRYTPGAVGSPVWESMTPLQDGESYYTDSPVERNAPLAGEYTFACRSLDTSGNPSTALVRTITLGQRRTGRVFDEYNERSAGWPGTPGSMTELIDPINGGSYLEATDSTTWASLTTWDAWTRWNMNPASPCSYTSAVQDLGTVLAGQIDVPLLDADGSEVVEIRSSLDNVTFTAWGSPASAFTARYVQIRITLTATGGKPVPALRQFGWQVSADLKREYLNDINIATLTGSYRIGTGDVRVPLANSYAVIKRLGVTIQDSGAGSWTWQRIDNVLTFGPRIQFRYNGTLADPALVDFDIEGI